MLLVCITLGFRHSNNGLFLLLVQVPGMLPSTTMGRSGLTNTTRTILGASIRLHTPSRRSQLLLPIANLTVLLSMATTTSGSLRIIHRSLVLQNIPRLASCWNTKFAALQQVV